MKDKLHEVRLNAYKEIAKRKGMDKEEELLLGLFMSLSRIGIAIETSQPKQTSDKIIMSFSNLFDKDGKIDAITASRMASHIFFCISLNSNNLEKEIIIRYIMWDTGLTHKQVDEGFKLTNVEFFPVFAKSLLGHNLIVANSKPAGVIIKDGVRKGELTHIGHKSIYERLITRELITETVVLHDGELYTHAIYIIKPTPLIDKIKKLFRISK